MVNIKFIVAAALVAATAAASAVTDVYRLTMRLHVPQVVDNMESKGRRVYKSQTLVGELRVKYRDEGTADVEITALTNKSFKVGGYPVTYEVFTASTIWNLIGDNKTQVFTRPSVFLRAEAQPSYVAAYEPTDDNSLIMNLSGKGSSRRAIYGYVTGTLGCGCADYGHISPTRIMGAYGYLPFVSDIAAIYGSWRISLKKTIYD